MSSFMLNYCIVATKCCSLTILELNVSFNGQVLLISTHKCLEMDFDVIEVEDKYIILFEENIFFITYKLQGGVFQPIT